MTSWLHRRARYAKVRYRTRFPRRLPEEDRPISMEMERDSRTLLIAFGGMRGRIGMPPFEFLSLTGEMPVKRMFVRDLRQAWYHHGIPGHGDTLLEAVSSLRALLEGHEVDRLIVAGNSSGGYAALVFGTMLEADTVLCFAPQTVLGLDELAAMDDHRWDERLLEVGASRPLDPRWIDLGAALPTARRSDVRYQVYFDETLQTDRLHVQRLKGLPGLRLYPFGRGGHHLVRKLRDQGHLARVVRKALEVPAEPESQPRERLS
jgi:pimeloyl-ACP methyl ester carboxylesterase